MICKLGDGIITHCGKKVKYLSLLKSKGYNIANGIVIDFDEFKQMVKEQNLDFDGIDKLYIKENYILNIVSLLDSSKQYIVRSSYSIQGDEDRILKCKFDTFYNVALDSESLKETIKSCFLSLYSMDNLRYYKDNNIDISSVQMSIVIQEMIDSSISGVLFTVNPINGKDTEIVIEYEKESNILSDEKASSERIIYDWMREEYILEPQRKVLSEFLLKELVSIALSMQQDLKAPVSIEFGIYDSKLYIVQASLISNIDFKEVYSNFTNAVLRENGISSEPCSKFMWSIYQRAWNYALYNFIKTSTVLKDGEIQNSLIMLRFSKPYWNISTVKKALENIPGYVEREFDSQIGVTNYSRFDKAPVKDKTFSIKNIKFKFAFKRVISKQSKEISFLLKEQKQELESQKSKIYSMSRNQLENGLEELVNGLYLTNETSYLWQIYINIIYRIMLRNELREYMSDEEFKNLLINIEEISHVRPFNNMWEFSRKILEDKERLQFFESNLDAEIFYLYRKDRNNENIKDFLTDFIDKYGYLSFKNSNVLYKSFDEDILRVIKMFRDIMDLEINNVTGNLMEEKRIYEKTLSKLSKKTGKFKFKIINRKIQLMRKFLKDKEELKDLQIKTYDLIRKYMLRLGEIYKDEFIIESPEEIFHLRLEELQEFINLKDERKLKKRIVKNRIYYKSFEEFNLINDIEATNVSYIDTKFQNKLRGIGASNGRVKGYAYVIDNIDQLKDIKKGEIVVSKNTSVDWTAYFTKINGIIIEQGGILCHCAIKSRENAIPCIVGVEGVTKKIKTGDYISIDGTTGEIIIQ